MKDSEKQATRPAAKKQDASATFMAEHDGRKQWLTRKDIEKEYGWSPKTTARIERFPNSKLVPTIVGSGKKGSGIKRYFRPHIEALLRDNFVSLRALTDESEVA